MKTVSKSRQLLERVAINLTNVVRFGLKSVLNICRITENNGLLTVER